MRLPKSGLVFVVGLGLVLSGCGAPHIRIARPEYVYDTVIRIKTPPVTNINPVAASTHGSDLYAQMVYQTLVNSSPNGEPAPGLAESWSHNGTFTRWTFDLNPYAKWWNGRPVSAQDVLWTINFYRNPQSGFDRRGELRHLAGVRILTPTAVEILLNHGDPTFAANLASPAGGLWILPSFLLHGKSLPSVRHSRFLTDLKDVMGNGPYRPYHLTGQRLHWAANPHYDLGSPRTKYLEWVWHPTKPVDLAWDIGPRQELLPGTRPITTTSPEEWIMTVVSPAGSPPAPEARTILDAATGRKLLPGIPVTHRSMSLSVALARAGYRNRRNLWVSRSGIPLRIHLASPKHGMGGQMGNVLLHEWRQEGLDVSRSATAFDTVNVRIKARWLTPSPAPLGPQDVALVRSPQNWTTSQRLTDWLPNVWQPFYKVELWRARSLVKKARQ